MSTAGAELELLKDLFVHFYDEDYAQIYSPMITFWFMVSQRLKKDHTMSEVQQDLADGGANGLTPPGGISPTDRRWLSVSTSSYSDARQRLEIAELEEVFKTWTVKMAAHTKSAQGPVYRDIDLREKLKGLSIQLLDGTTFRIPSLGNIAETYSPANNQHGASYWCQIRAVGGFCLKSGALLSISHGTQHQSEQELSVSLFRSVKEPTLFVGDSNFGVYSMFESATACSHDLLTAVTKERAHCLLGDGVLEVGEECEVLWIPSERDKHYPGATRNPIRCRLFRQQITVKGEEQDLYLLTTLLDSQAYPIDFLFDLYGCRWLVEIDFKYLKTHLEMNTLEVKSAEMAIKELFAGLHAYNMIRLVMWGAARKQEFNPLRLSFSDCVRAFLRKVHHLWSQNNCFTTLPWKKFWRKVLKTIGSMRLPKRRKKRLSEPRMVRRRPATFPSLKGSREEARKALLEPG